MTADATTQDRADELEERFAVPVALAAVAAVPAVFLSMLDGWPRLVGETINYLTLTVFAAEFVVLLWAADDKWKWVREHKFLVGVFLVAIPAVLLFVGAVQVLRLLRATRALGALRITRVRRIIKAVRKIGRAAALTGLWLRLAQASIAASGVAFVVIVLADPDSQSRQVLESVVDAYGVVPVASAGLAAAGLAVGAYTIYRSVAAEEEAE
jgi:CsoR family transcriptional regulator, copper-sensing transcriptional repressor